MKKAHKLLTGTIAAAVVASVSVTTPIVTQAAVQFKDISENAYYYNDVQWLVQEGIINGYTDGTFRPNDSLSREHAALMFVRALKLNVPDQADSILEKYNDINRNGSSATSLAAFLSAGISAEDSSYFYPAAPLTREVMASWLVSAFKFKEKSNADVPFKDASTISSDHLPNVKILYENEIIQGNTDGTYAPKNSVTRAQFATFMKRALTLYEPTKEPEEEETTSSLQIEDVESLNLKQVQITTNHTSYNKQDVMNKELYKIEDSSGNTINIVDVQLNQKEITLTLEKALKASDKAKLVVDSAITGKKEDFTVSFKDNKEPEVVSVTATSKNSYLLTFSEPLDFGVENGKRITEEDLFDSLEIDGDKYSIEKMTVQQYGQALHVEIGANLREGDHKLEFLDTDWFQDYAGNELDVKSIDFTMKYDTAAPTLVDIKNIQPNQLTLIFDKQIKLRYRGYLYHTSSSHYPSQVTVQNGNELVLTFDSGHLITKSTDLILENGAIEDLWGNQNKKVTKSFQIAEDKTPPTITNVEFLDSTVANTKNIKMKVTFSESVKTDVADDIDKYKLKDEKGNTIKIKDIAFESNSDKEKIATFTIDKYYGELSKQKFTLEADKIRDLVGNESKDMEYSFTASSEEPPGDFTAKMIVNDAEDEVRIVVDFGKEMALSGSSSINQLDLYELTVNKTKVLIEDLQNVSGLDVTFKALQDGEKAEILIEKTGKIADAWDDFFDDLLDAVDDEDLDEVGLVVGRVADANGNRTQSIVNKVKLSVQGEFDVDQVTAKAVDEETIKLTFEDELTDFDDDDFIVYWDKDSDGKFDSNEDLDFSAKVNTVDGASVVTIKLDDEEFDVDGKYKNKYVYIKTANKVSTKNRYGQKIDIDKLRVEDGIAPEIATFKDTEKVYVQAVTNDSSRAIVSIEFTDDIDKDTLTRLSFIIGDGKKYEIESVAVENSDTICFVVKLDGNRAKDLVGEYVKQKAAISDENDNIIDDIDVRINEEKSSRSKP